MRRLNFLHALKQGWRSHALYPRRERTGGAAPAKLASCQVGDARLLPFADGSARAVLLLGPLYHLVHAEDRHRALCEAARVLVPGGVLIASAISRWASALDGAMRDRLADPDFASIVEQDVKDGQHRNPTGRLDYFTTAYFHRPADLRQDVERAGLPDTFQTKLATALAHYGVTDLERSPELEAAVFRIFLAQQRASHDAAIITALLRTWLQEPPPPAALHEPVGLALERLVAYYEARGPADEAAAWRKKLDEHKKK